ncbi:hypothetical protein [Sphingomonas jatrophae]|nr:hypothetical protein [Sphingomonas jatrophae]
MDTFLAAMTSAVRAEMQAIVEQEAQAASERVRERLKQIGPELAMRLLSQFDVSRQEQHVVIKFRMDS